MSFFVPEVARVTSGIAEVLRSTSVDGNNGVFVIGSPEPGWRLLTIASDGYGWEHVSVRAVRDVTDQSRIPTWREMCHAKDAFWGGEDEVVQFHPKRSEYVNCHPHVLHLWRPVGQKIPTPPSDFVGPLALTL